MPRPLLSCAAGGEELVLAPETHNCVYPRIHIPQAQAADFSAWPELNQWGYRDSRE